MFKLDFKAKIPLEVMIRHPYLGIFGKKTLLEMLVTFNVIFFRHNAPRLGVMGTRQGATKPLAQFGVMLLAS